MMAGWIFFIFGKRIRYNEWAPDAQHIEFGSVPNNGNCFKTFEWCDIREKNVVIFFMFGID